MPNMACTNPRHIGILVCNTHRYVYIYCVYSVYCIVYSVYCIQYTVYTAYTVCEYYTYTIESRVYRGIGAGV